MSNTSLNNVQALNEVTVAKGNTTKANTKTSTSKEFEKFFKKASTENKNALQNKNNVENKNINEENSKGKDVKSTDNTNLSKTDDKSLENNGASEENTIEAEIEKLKGSTSKEDYIKNLTSLLEKMLNGEINIDLNLIQKALKELNGEMFNQIAVSTDSESISKIKNDILQIMNKNFNGEFNLKEIGNKPLSEIFDFIAKLPSMNTPENSEFKTQVIKILKDKLESPNIKLESQNVKDKSLDSSQVLNGNIKNTKTDLILNLSKMDDETSSESFGESDSESELLKRLAFSDKDDEKPQFQRVINYMGRVNNTQGINPVVEVDSKNLGVVNSKNIVEDLVKDVKFMQLNNVKEMTVKINPKDLGQLIIRVTVENGIMKANITAQNKEAYNLLNTNYSELNSKLSDDGIKIQNFTIDIYNGDTTFFSNEKNKHENQQGSSKGNKANVILNEEDTASVENSNTVDSNSVNAFV